MSDSETERSEEVPRGGAVMKVVAWLGEGEGVAPSTGDFRLNRECCRCGAVRGRCPPDGGRPGITARRGLTGEGVITAGEIDLAETGEPGGDRLERRGEPE